MITDKQFEDAFTAAGGWFLLTQYEEIVNWKGSKKDLVDRVFVFLKLMGGISHVERCEVPSCCVYRLERIRDPVSRSS